MTSNCKLCDGTGIYFKPNGEDDYDKEPCPCMDEQVSENETKGDIIRMSANVN